MYSAIRSLVIKSRSSSRSPATKSVTLVRSGWVQFASAALVAIAVSSPWVQGLVSRSPATIIKSIIYLQPSPKPKEKGRHVWQPCPARIGQTLLTLTARKQQCLARNPAGIVRSEENRCRSDVRRLRNAPKRRSRLDMLAEVALGKPHGMKAFRLDHARVQRVHANLLRSKLLRQRNRNGVDRCLGSAVNRPNRHRHRTHDRADVDDRAAIRPDVLHRLLRRQQQAQHIQVELRVEVLRSNRLQRLEVEDPGIIDENIDLPIGRDGLLEQPNNIFLLRNIALHRDGLAALARNLPDH